MTQALKQESIMAGGWTPQQGSWDDAEPPESGSGGNYDDGLRSFWMPPGGTKRIMVVTGMPMCAWMHSMYEFTRETKDMEVCLKKNRIDDDCEPCARDSYPSFVGWFGVIDMGDVVEGPDGIRLEGWTSPKTGRVYQFTKKKFAAKRGSKDKPGTLPKLDKLRKRYGRDGTLAGCVFDVERGGSKDPGVGSDFHFVEHVPKERWRDYFLELGADPELLDLGEIDWRAEIVPKTPERLRRLCGGGGGGSGNPRPSQRDDDPGWGGSSSSDSESYGHADEDTPF